MHGERIREDDVSRRGLRTSCPQAAEMQFERPQISQMYTDEEFVATDCSDVHRLENPIDMGFKASQQTESYELPYSHNLLKRFLKS